MARPVGRGLQLEDGKSRRRPARLGGQRLHRKLRDRRPRCRDEYKTGATAVGRGGTVGNAYTGNSVSAGQAKVYNPNTGNTTKVGGVSSSNGGSAARVGDTAVGKTSSGDYYATKDGNVYKNTGDGWQEKGSSSNSWSNVNDQAKTQQLSKESSARSTGQQRYDSFQSNGGASRSQNNWGNSSRSGASTRQTSRPSGGGARRP